MATKSKNDKAKSDKASKIILEQVRSAAGRERTVLLTLKALGLGRIGKKIEIVSNPSVLGMVKKVEHLLKVHN